jgi:hypothetical protein
MSRVELFFANVGGGAGLVATFTWTGAAQFFAATATGVWMLAQTFILWRRQRCTKATCPNRRPS